MEGITVDGRKRGNALKYSRAFTLIWFEFYMHTLTNLIKVVLLMLSVIHFVCLTPILSHYAELVLWLHIAIEIYIIKSTKLIHSLGKFLHVLLKIHKHCEPIKSFNSNIGKSPIIDMLTCVFMYKNGLLKFLLLLKACLDDCYYLFTNFVNEVTCKGSLWGIFIISFKYSVSQRLLFSASWLVVRTTITIIWA